MESWRRDLSKDSVPIEIINNQLREYKHETNFWDRYEEPHFQRNRWNMDRMFIEIVFLIC